MFTYSFCRNIISREHTYRLGSDALEWNDGDRIEYASVAEVRLSWFRLRGALAATRARALSCTLHCRSSSKISLLPIHYARWGVWEDRSAAFYPFVRELLARIKAANPAVKTVRRFHWSIKLKKDVGRVLGPVAVWVLRLMRRGDPDRMADFGAKLARTVGPWLRGHRIARANLVAAFPQKSKAEIDQILSGMWDHFGRQPAEYAHLDRLWDYDPVQPQGKRVECDRLTVERLERLRASGTPALFFGAHFGNFELPAVGAAALGFELAALYRELDFNSLTEAIVGIRTKSMGTLIGSGPGAAFKIKKALRDGMHFGALVDRHFTRGVDVTFFRRRCKANPLIARLAQASDRPIHGFRVIRLPGHRFRFDLTEAITPPRDANGIIDVAATTQMITTIIELWIRQYPEQWIWVNRRWR